MRRLWRSLIARGCLVSDDQRNLSARGFTYVCTHGPNAVCNICVYDQDDGLDKGLQTPRLGRLQLWMFKRGWRHLPNTLSSFRYILWRITGGSYD
jgi:hypothetical protein